MPASSDLRAPSLHRLWRVFGLLAAAGCLFGCTAAARAGTDPDYFATRDFGLELQREFQTRRSKAVVDRLDSQAMLVRVFEPFGPDILTDPRSHEMWNQFSFPKLVQELGSYDEGYTFIVSRVVLLDGARCLECVLLDSTNAISLLMLRLKRGADGKIRIEDLQFSGSELEVSRTLRQSLILAGLRTSRLLDPEEEALTSLASRHIMRAAEIFAAIRDMKYDWAFTLMRGDFRDLDHTRIWREIRNRLATFGSAAALRHLEEECASGQVTESFLRYAIISRQGNNARTLEALEQVLIDHREPPMLCAMKAALLLEMDRTTEALRLAQSLYARNPLSGTAHCVAVQAAARTADITAAFAALEAWQMFTPRDEIDKLLAQDPLTTPFRDSARYVAWRETPSPVALSATALPPAAK